MTPLDQTRPLDFACAYNDSDLEILVDVLMSWDFAVMNYYHLVDLRKTSIEKLYPTKCMNIIKTLFECKIISYKIMNIIKTLFDMIF